MWYLAQHESSLLRFRRGSEQSNALPIDTVVQTGFPTEIRCSRVVQFDSELATLLSLLPDLRLRLDRMKADLLLKLLTRQPQIAANMLVLRRELPGANVGSMVSRYPAILTDMSGSVIEANLQRVRYATAM
jgi:hypothetical protein